ncbi:MAG: hypothetical protein ACAH09_11175 [Methylophilaceae bacterium]|jgi:hypothetical protein|nr:hypothetical protein [Methylophilaceae bacterium]
MQTNRQQLDEAPRYPIGTLYEPDERCYKLEGELQWQNCTHYF